MKSASNALSHQTTFQTNAAAQVTAVTTPLSKTTTFTYDVGDLTATRFIA